MSDLESIYTDILAEGEGGGSDPAVDNPIDDVVIDEIVDDVDDSQDSTDTGTVVDDVDDVVVDEDASDDTVSSDAGFNWKDYKDSLVEVTVGGQAVKVPLSEAMSGFMRQADYTRKTQELASQRQVIEAYQEFAQDFRRDPVRVITDLARAAGLNPAQVFESDNRFADDDDSDAPARQELAEVQRLRAEMDAMRQDMEHRQLVEQIKSEIRELETLYPDFDRDAILPLAAQRGMSLDDAYMVWKAAEIRREATQRQEAEKVAAEKAKRVAAKRDQAATVSKGRTTRAASDVDDSEFNTFGEMLEAAFASQ